MRLFYLWLIPLIWGVCCWMGFYYPGDEYAMWAIGSIAGTWVAFVFGVGDLHSILFRLGVVGAGVLPMAVAGALLDWLKVRRWSWLLSYALCFTAIFCISVFSYPSLAKALSKNGSWWAYIFFSGNAGLYVSTVAIVILTPLSRVIFRTRRQPEPPAE